MNLLENPQNRRTDVGEDERYPVDAWIGSECLDPNSPRGCCRAQRSPAENENLADEEERCLGHKSHHNCTLFHSISREIARVLGK